MYIPTDPKLTKAPDSLRRELKEVLSKIWENQYFLDRKDLEKLEYFGKKGFNLKV